MKTPIEVTVLATSKTDIIAFNMKWQINVFIYYSESLVTIISPVLLCTTTFFCFILSFL